MPKNQEIPTVRYAERASRNLQLIWLATTDQGLWALSYGVDEEGFREEIMERGPANLKYDEDRCAPMLDQIESYLSGERLTFDLPIDWRGMSDFQIAVRKAVMALPFGSTASYGDIAAAVGNPRAARAVGGVQAANPISFVIPCHRVIGSDGSLHGYGGFGGIETKAWLLEMEANRAQNSE